MLFIIKNMNLPALNFVEAPVSVLACNTGSLPIEYFMPCYCLELV